LFAGFLFVTGILYVLKTKRSRLALMGAASLLDGVRQARYSGQILCLFPNKSKFIFQFLSLNLPLSQP
jgi:hypothetical protein